MPEHRLQKTRNAYLPSTTDRSNWWPRMRPIGELAYQHIVASDEAVARRLQDLQMEHDESRTP